MKKIMCFLFIIALLPVLLFAERTSCYFIDGFEVTVDEGFSIHVQEKNSYDAKEFAVISPDNEVLECNIILFDKFTEERNDRDIENLLISEVYFYLANLGIPMKGSLFNFNKKAMEGFSGYLVDFELNNQTTYLYVIDIREAPGFGGIILVTYKNGSGNKTKIVLEKILTHVRVIIHEAAG